ncbi:MAG: 16S rRNA (cytosine(1402)-N(4))-methyltransferase RsmH [Coriobacteriia bacterium]|nr:16S rRNA (cytosine(1402)-N(4))-methyltransferase RsmH [Coriobacteriia bacterium]
MTMEYRHIPVLLAEVTQQLSPQPGSIIVDCTLGGAGHAKRFQDLVAPTGTLVGIDQDDAALAAAAVTLRLGQHDSTARTVLLKGNFADLDTLLIDAGVPCVDGFLFDLGVSSHQLDFPERGFSYNEDAPLDMRMDPGRQTLTAAEVIATYTAADLTRIIRDYSDERWASRIAAFIVEERAHHPIATTLQLVEVIKAAVPAAARREGPHPAKRTFQALRIEVNDELGVLATALRAAIRWLSPGGRVAVISYQSLEDRIVKTIFTELAGRCTCPPELPVCTCTHTPVLRIVTRKAILPTVEEIRQNPRARSAKLRVAERV